ncbi:DNA binding domain-containing protein, excisionase family [Actinopolyspora xinjiangensis]|uniref:DNA binding domain-containing protein, excisionase family n=1 Tax=Actinopolyspora xinjiangensis TaxID=405564 RepID=A0A1H0VJ10_9ACTN|nr:helix-turn-helix domain-containing protein [Actinopolyspora xinjiangensis]SDP78301.1 DNA binding domain-containing protein, excisionase family [Actinopolyspora xinjiangensis]
MPEQDTRMLRVSAVAARYDVSRSTIYRAIESGELTALKIGAGKGTLRVPESALVDYERACERAAHEVYVTGDASAAVDDEGAIDHSDVRGEVA